MLIAFARIACWLATPLVALMAVGLIWLVWEMLTFSLTGKWPF